MIGWAGLGWEEMRSSGGSDQGREGSRVLCGLFLEVSMMLLPPLLHLQYVIESSARRRMGGSSEWKVKDDARGLH